MLIQLAIVSTYNSGQTARRDLVNFIEGSPNVKEYTSVSSHGIVRLSITKQGFSNLPIPSDIGDIFLGIINAK